jgi:Glycosyl hydrolase family 99
MWGASARFKGWSTRVLCLLFSALVVASCAVPPASAAATPTSDPIPVFAYYYIWFDTSSWNRAKTDYPQLGRYSSDDANVMRQHIEWAKSAGINGFIVSWKNTDSLNRRLAQLVSIADQEDFKLAIIYEGLDFNRNPLPVGQVSDGLDYFINHYSGNPAFDSFGQPLMILSGTWKFSRGEIASLVQGRRKSLHILASEKNLQGYNRLADLVDGNAYYWSSVNPDTFTGYADKLSAMGKAVHANGGYWIAPASPGFDARLVGGTSVVDRKNGQTLRTEMSVAYQSAPDMIGLISWNEFSENSYIEPSQAYGDRYLQVMSDIRHLANPPVTNFDSSDSGTTPYHFSLGQVAALGGLGTLILIALVIIFRRIKQ